MRRKRIASGPEGACRPKRSGSMQPARRKLRGALWRARRDRVVLQKRRRQWHARCGPKASERVWSVRHAGKRLGGGERLVRPELLPKQPLIRSRRPRQRDDSNSAGRVLGALPQGRPRIFPLSRLSGGHVRLRRRAALHGRSERSLENRDEFWTLDRPEELNGAQENASNRRPHQYESGPQQRSIPAQVSFLDFLHR